MAISLVNGLPRNSDVSSINVQDVEHARINNQFFLKGASPKFPSVFGAGNSDKMVIFLEFVNVAIGATYLIKDRNGNTLSGAMTAEFLSDGHHALRLDGGVELTGTILGAKGFFVQK